MKYFVVTSTIKDGEYEYMSQSPVEARTAKKAREKVEKENDEWIKNDYRLQEVMWPREITKAEYDVIKKYIY